MKFDEILEQQAGEFGPYQKRVYVLVCLPAVCAAFMTLLPVFILATPNHRCHLPGWSNDTYRAQSEQHQALINVSIPLEKHLYEGEPQLSSCQLYDHADINSPGSLALHNGTALNETDRIKCNKWVYDDSEYVTAVNDFDMVCENSIFTSHFNMITFSGSLIGAFITGALSDLIGRKKVFISCLIVNMVVTVVQILAPFYWLFLATRFVQGLAGSGVFSVSFVYVMEIVGPNYRMFAGIFIEMFWCAGLFVLVGGAYFIRYWKYLMAIMIAPAVFFLSYFWIIPESPRWLISVGQFDEAENILQKIAHSNKRTLHEKILDAAPVVEEEKEATAKKESAQVWKLFAHKVLFHRFLIVAFNRFALDLSYYGISLNIEHLSGNLYLNYTLSSAVETAASIVVLFLIFRWGRKPLYSAHLIVGSMGFLLSTLPIFIGGENNNVYSVGLVMVGKFGISAAYAVFYVYLSEIFPTSIRSSAMALLFVTGMIGGVVSPYVVEFGDLMNERMAAAFPMLVFGSLTFIAALLSLLLPETKNKAMPENINEAIKIGNHDETQF